MPAFLPRLLTSTLKEALEAFPAVLLTGPRQSTLLREELGAESDYVTFDDPLEREFARSDPEGFLDRFGARRAILDEVQYVPELFQYLKIRIDRDRSLHGRWVLTGPQHFGLMARVTESLASRVAILELFPLGLSELPESQRGTADQAIWLGGYPEPRLRPEARDLWMRSYLRTYVERDVRQLQNIQDLRAFESAEAALAGAMGGALFEGLVVSEAIKALTHRGLRADLYFWRSQDGLEIDLLVPVGNRLLPVEIKATATPTRRHAQIFDRFRRVAGDLAAERGALVCRVREQRPLPGGHLALPWSEFPDWLGGEVAG